MFSYESRGGGRGGPFVMVVALVLGLCVAGWFAYRVLDGSAAASDSSTGTGDARVTSAQDRTDGVRPHSAPTAPALPARSSHQSSRDSRDSQSKPLAKTLPLAGKVVVLDPGHNPNNYKHPASINRLVDVGTGRKACDTTGTATNAGYSEASYTLDVSRRVRTILLARGAKVSLTQNGATTYGPCVDQRAAIGNKAHANVAVSIHADGAAAKAYGFHVIAPKSLHAGRADTRKIAARSLTLATTLRAHFKSATGEPFATYLGGGTGLMVRGDLGGLNLSTVPKVFIECGNMRNAHDAKALTSAAWRQKAAQGIADGLTAFLQGKK